jgi:uncharacterized RDD family membrane protein YckC
VSFCTQCGAKISGDAQFCTVCGRPLIPAPAPGGRSAPSLPPQVVAILRDGTGHPAYAGFWARASAYSIDYTLVSVVTTAFLLVIFRMLGISLIPMGEGLGDSSGSMSMFGQIVILELVDIVTTGIYFAWMESSIWQATLGKRMLGIRVTDLGGRRISFARASGRYLAKLVSSLAFCVGFMMAAFTEKKQALHDIMAGTLVVKKI